MPRVPSAFLQKGAPQVPDDEPSSSNESQSLVGCPPPPRLEDVCQGALQPTTNRARKHPTRSVYRPTRPTEMCPSSGCISLDYVILPLFIWLSRLSFANLQLLLIGKSDDICRQFVDSGHIWKSPAKNSSNSYSSALRASFSTKKWFRHSSFIMHFGI